MVFYDMPEHEKKAFFELLDEYFATRGSTAALVGAKGLKPALSNISKDPESAKAMVSGLGRAAASSASDDSAKSGAGNLNFAGRVAAVSSAFGGGGANKMPPPKQLGRFVPGGASGAKAPPPPRRLGREEEKEKEEWAKVLYDFEPQDEGELRLREGQRVRVNEKSGNGWWEGEVDGEKGLFPASYVELVTS